MPTNQLDAWTALGDPTRRAVFERIIRQPTSVGELAEGLPVSRPAVSQHLRALKEAGLVIDRAAGTRRIYSVDRDGLAELRSQIEAFWSSALDTYKTIVEESMKGEK